MSEDVDDALGHVALDVGLHHVGHLGPPLPQSPQPPAPDNALRAHNTKDGRNRLMQRARVEQQSQKLPSCVISAILQVGSCKNA